MKTIVKFAAAAALMLVSTSAMAQYTPEKGNIMTEVQFNPFGNNFNTFRLNGLQLKGRYFLTDNDAIRVKLGLEIDNTNEVTKTTLKDDFDTNKPAYTLKNQEVETNNNKAQFQFAAGYERHFAKEGRFDVYAGAELGLSLTAYSADRTTTINNDVMTGTTGSTLRTQTTSTQKEEFENQNATGNISSNELFAGIFTGVDFYIYKGLYIGTELGIRFATGANRVNPKLTTTFNEKVVTTNTVGTTSTVGTKTTNWTENSETGVRTGNTVTIAGATTTDNKIEQASPATDREVTRTTLNFYIEPALRLGWRF